jgi:hypothetical protein
MKFPRYGFVCAACFCLFSIAGCGGGSENGSRPITQEAAGRATFTVQWPPVNPSRLIPAAANSIQVKIMRGTAVLGERVLARPAAGGPVSVTFERLPVGELLASAAAFPGPGAGGVAQAQAQLPITVLQGQTVAVQLTMASTITGIEVTPVAPSVVAGQQVGLTATARDAGGNVVLTALGKLEWRSLDTSVATVDAATGMLTGVASGSTIIEVKDTESGKVGSATVSVLPQSQVVYRNDFEGASPGAEWSNTLTSVSPRGARRFLGQFGNGTVNLNLANLPAHRSVTVTFDLMIIRTWDGNMAVNRFGLAVGPDVWRLTHSGGAVLLNTTFSNWEPAATPDNVPQAYPGTFPGGIFTARTGAVENNVLGYEDPGGGYPGRVQDSIYRLTYTFDHTANSLALGFTSLQNQTVDDEGWGLDNVQVQINR